MQNRFMSCVGILLIFSVAILFSRNRRGIRWQSLGLGLSLQVGFAVLILGIPSLGVPGVLRFIFNVLNLVVLALIECTSKGSRFLFGPLAEIRDPWGFVFAFRVLPSVIFFSALMALLYHLGILQKVVRTFAWVMQKTLKTSGAETLSTSGNIFMGQTEAPLMIKPFLANMTQSEIYAIMVGGMSTIAAGVEAAYVGLLQGRISDIAGHLLTASAMNAIASLTIAKIIFPENGVPESAGTMIFTKERQDANALEAVSRGASEGVQLALNVGGMLIAFISIIAVFDAVLGKVGVWLHFAEPLSFALVLGTIFKPLPWLLGVPWSETAAVGRLIGEKVVINEFVAYVHLAEIGAKLSDRTVLITAYALSSFANFSSIGIQIGGIGAMAPTQRSTLARLGLLALLGGNLSCMLSACIAGILF